MSALGGKSDTPDFLATIYPLRSQIVTFAVIGFHRDRSAWPMSSEELSAYASSSPANPIVPEGALTSLEVSKKEDGGIVYSTLEDRQRGREFSIFSAYKVSFPVPSYIFTSSTSPAASVPRSTSIGFDWGQAIADAIVRASSLKNEDGAQPGARPNARSAWVILNVGLRKACSRTLQ